MTSATSRTPRSAQSLVGIIKKPHSRKPESCYKLSGLLLIKLQAFQHAALYGCEMTGCARQRSEGFRWRPSSDWAGWELRGNVSVLMRLGTRRPTSDTGGNNVPLASNAKTRLAFFQLDRRGVCLAGALRSLLLKTSVQQRSRGCFRMFKPYPKSLKSSSRSLLTFSVSTWTTSFASGFSSHSGGPDGSFKNATIDWRSGKKNNKTTKSQKVSKQWLHYKQNHAVDNNVICVNAVKAPPNLNLTQWNGIFRAQHVHVCCGCNVMCMS